MPHQWDGGPTINPPMVTRLRPTLRLSQLSRYFRSTGVTLIPQTHNTAMSYPTTVKSVGINKNGGVEVIEDLVLPFPQVKPTDLLVKVGHHTSTSRTH